MNIRDVQIPKRMRALPRDPRGYPIPWMVWVDRQGKAHFTVNDESKRTLAFVDDLCSICGTKLLKLRWFVGGPLSAFHPDGAYYDPPVHRDCAHYALKVCPWLAMPSYGRSGKRIDAKTVHDADKHRVFVDNTQIKERPVTFVAVCANDQVVRFNPDPPQVKPIRPYVAIEFWKDGRQINRAVALKLLAEAFPHVRVPATSESGVAGKLPGVLVDSFADAG